jgi:hypothetical protein
MIEWFLIAAGVVLPWAHAVTLYRRSRKLRSDSNDADAASMQAAFWRAKAIDLGAEEDEFRREHMEKP